MQGVGAETVGQAARGATGNESAVQQASGTGRADKGSAVNGTELSAREMGIVQYKDVQMRIMPTSLEELESMIWQEVDEENWETYHCEIFVNCEAIRDELTPERIEFYSNFCQVWELFSVDVVLENLKDEN